MDDLVEKVAKVIDDYSDEIYGILEFGYSDDVIEKAAKAALAAIQETHAIVPKEPTAKMLIGAVISLRGGLHNPMQNLGDVKAVYKAMIEASPHGSPD